MALRAKIRAPAGIFTRLSLVEMDRDVHQTNVASATANYARFQASAMIQAASMLTLCLITARTHARILTVAQITEVASPSLILEFSKNLWTK
tara:strand:- start:1732 stop:2007 length:276 start_codon:yes stop_codon:yes gene_type:complete